MVQGLRWTWCSTWQQVWSQAVGAHGTLLLQHARCENRLSGCGCAHQQEQGGMLPPQVSWGGTPGHPFMPGLGRSAFALAGSAWQPGVSEQPHSWMCTMAGWLLCTGTEPPPLQLLWLPDMLNNWPQQRIGGQFLAVAPCGSLHHWLPAANREPAYLKECWCAHAPHPKSMCCKHGGGMVVGGQSAGLSLRRAMACNCTWACITAAAAADGSCCTTAQAVLADRCGNCGSSSAGAGCVASVMCRHHSACDPSSSGHGRRLTAAQLDRASTWDCHRGTACGPLLYQCVVADVLAATAVPLHPIGAA
jgi:hypothetical protein